MTQEEAERKAAMDVWELTGEKVDLAEVGIRVEVCECPFPHCPGYELKARNAMGQSYLAGLLHRRIE